MTVDDVLTEARAQVVLRPRGWRDQAGDRGAVVLDLTRVQRGRLRLELSPALALHLAGELRDAAVRAEAADAASGGWVAG